MSYVYIRSSPGTLDTWTVGFYDPRGVWIPESDHIDPDKAAARVHWLNGGSASQAKVSRGLIDPAKALEPRADNAEDGRQC